MYSDNGTVVRTNNYLIFLNGLCSKEEAADCNTVQVLWTGLGYRRAEKSLRECDAKMTNIPLWSDTRSPRALPAQRGVGQQARAAPRRWPVVPSKHPRTVTGGSTAACQPATEPGAQRRAELKQLVLGHCSRAGGRNQKGQCVIRHRSTAPHLLQRSWGVRHTGGGEKQNWKTLSLPGEVKTALKITTQNSVAWGLLRESWSLPLLVVLGKVLGFFYVHGKLLFGGVGEQHDGL